MLLLIFPFLFSCAVPCINAEAYNNRGVAYAAKGQYDQAISDYNKALEMDPRFAMAYYNRGLAYWRKGQHDQAILDFNKALELNPRDGEAYNNRGSWYRYKGQYDQAIADFNKALEINPNNAVAYFNRAPQDWLDHWEMAGGVRAVVAEYLSLLPSYLAAWLLANTSPVLRVAQPQLALLENGQAELALSSQAPTIMLPAAEPTESPRLAAPESEMSPVGATSKRPSSVMNPDLSARKDSLLERIPMAIGQQLISITADLHYLQITTRRGRTTILGSLTEAETELGECGLRIHRSHWIALDAVRRLRRTANGWRCELVNGRTLPVSRRRVAEAKLRLGSDFVVEDQEGGVVA